MGFRAAALLLRRFVKVFTKDLPKRMPLTARFFRLLFPVLEFGVSFLA